MPISPATSSPAQVRQAIANAAARTGASFGYLYREAQLESGLDPAAKAATSSAAGLFQFTRGTWRSMLQRHGAEHGVTGLGAESDALRFDPQVAALMAGESAVEHATELGATLGRAPEDADLYLAHFLGIAGAKRFLTLLEEAPDTVAASEFPAAAAANRNVFYAPDGAARTLTEVRQFFATKLAGASVPQPLQPASTTAASASATTEQRRPLQLAAFEPMPGRLSLDFAARSYRRLAEFGA